jgi:hypothetical protein
MGGAVAGIAGGALKGIAGKALGGIGGGKGGGIGEIIKGLLEKVTGGGSGSGGGCGGGGGCGDASQAIGGLLSSKCSGGG